MICPGCSKLITDYLSTTPLVVMSNLTAALGDLTCPHCGKRIFLEFTLKKINGRRYKPREQKP